MADQRITKRIVDNLRPRAKEYAIWDSKLPGVGVRVRPSGAMSYVVVYRAGPGRGAPVRRFTIANVGKCTPEAARTRAKAILGEVAHGQDPAGQKATERGTLTVAALADRFMAEHVEQKRKPSTAAFYRHLLEKAIKPELGAIKADKVTRGQVARLHGKLKATPFQANRILAVIGSMYAFAGRGGIVPEGMNPARRIEQFREHRRERFLTSVELERLGSAIREAELRASRGPWTRRSRPLSIWQSRQTASPRSILSRPQRSDCCCLPVAASAKSYASGGSMWIWNAGCCCSPTRKRAGRP